MGLYKLNNLSGVTIMVRPTQPKGIKPKPDGGQGGGQTGSESGADMNSMKLVVINTVITLIICFLFVISNYFIVQNTVSGVLKKVSTVVGEETKEDEHAQGEHVERGVILDLGEFILNLTDPEMRTFLKIEVAIELTKTEEEKHAVHAPSGGGGHGHGHGAKPVDPIEEIKKKLVEFKPAVRDAVISVLSSKTAEELSSLAGKELAKEQIKEYVDSIMAGEREVLRISFGAFIIQQ